MHVSTKPLPATFALVFVLVVFITILYRIMYILNVVNPHFSDATPIRRSQNLTIDELAEKCDFQSPYLSDVERGERNITLQTLNKILDALNVGPGKVLIPENIADIEAADTRGELIQLVLNMLEDKNEDDLLMLLNISNEIFKTYKKN